EVDGFVHVLGRLDRFQDVSGATGDVHGELGDLHILEALVALRAELHACLEDVVEMARELLQLGLRIGLYPGIGRVLLGMDQDLHRGLPAEIPRGQKYGEYQPSGRHRAAVSNARVRWPGDRGRREQVPAGWAPRPRTTG